MLEGLISIKEAIKNPSWVFVISGVVSFICLIVAILVFETSIGLFTSLLITLAMTPFMLNLVRYEEERDEQLAETFKDMNFMERHRDILIIYTAFFCGLVLSMTIAYVVLPNNISQRMFMDQITEINKIRGKITFSDTLVGIVTNNVGVLFLSFLLSFLFGAGAILILAWNGSILAAAIGSIAKSAGGVKAIPVAALPFLPHGMFEILAYFIGGIAGGLVSAAIMRRKSGNFKFVMRDSMDLMLVSVFLLIIAGLIESAVLIA